MKTTEATGLHKKTLAWICQLRQVPQLQLGSQCRTRHYQVHHRAITCLCIDYPVKAVQNKGNDRPAPTSYVCLCLSHMQNHFVLMTMLRCVFVFKQPWLRRNNIQYDETVLKAELLALVKQFKSDPRYRIDQVTGEAGHTVLRVPPYHCDLNPIEIIWAQLKHHVAAYNVSFKLTDLQ